MELDTLLGSIRPADRAAMADAAAYADSLVKPLHSLGRLEALAVKLAGITGKRKNRFPKRAVLVMCADNGVVAEGVASAPQSVTASQTLNFAKGITGVCVLAKQAGAEVIPIDVGVNAALADDRIRNEKIRMGTANIAQGPAMTRAEAERALLVGARAARRAADEGYTLLGAGEMGIGNTTTASAVLCSLLGLSPEETSGKGAGLTEEAYRRKIEVIRTALAVNRPDANDVLDVLAKVGGLDIAAMAGVFLGGAACRVPVVMDGFISAVAALCAVRLCPAAADYIIPSHGSKEKGYALAAQALGLEPFLLLEMGLGEGSGCPIAFAVIDFACAMMNDMATFAEASIGGEYLENVKGAEF